MRRGDPGERRRRGKVSDGGSRRGRGTRGRRACDERRREAGARRRRKRRESRSRGRGERRREMRRGQSPQTRRRGRAKGAARTGGSALSIRPRGVLGALGLCLRAAACARALQAHTGGRGTCSSTGGRLRPRHTRPPNGGTRRSSFAARQTSGLLPAHAESLSTRSTLLACRCGLGCTGCLPAFPSRTKTRCALRTLGVELVPSRSRSFSTSTCCPPFPHWFGPPELLYCDFAVQGLSMALRRCAQLECGSAASAA